ncbi:hypothetical protein FPJ27_14860 [Burkholderia sp. MS455]|nr:hypothetical protein FPJ27_14860 [Burkholderia sp. MS455]
MQCRTGACEKVKDCCTTTGHIGPMVRTLMKDAREDLVRCSGVKSPVLSQVRPTRVQPASHHRWQCKVIFYLVMAVSFSKWQSVGALQALCSNRIGLEVLSVFQDRPGHPCILGRNRDGRTPISAAFD